MKHQHTSLGHYKLQGAIARQIAAGNTLVIVCGAVGGTLLTRYLAGKTQDAWLILGFASIGIIASVLVNYFILVRALRPLQDLRASLARPDPARAIADKGLLTYPDPIISQLAGTLHQALQQLEKRNQELGALAQRALYGQEEERKRIARGLHDDTGGSISSLILALDQIAARLQNGNDTTSLLEPVLQTRHLAAQTLADLRAVIYGLRPSMLDDLGLIPAIRWYAQTQLKDSKTISLSFEDHGMDCDLPETLAITLYRIAQELINNVLHHAGASHVTMRLSCQDDQVALFIQDNGVGFDPAGVSDREYGGRSPGEQPLGLLGIRERADLLGGEMTVTSSPGTGAAIEVRLPLHKREAVNYV